MKKIIFFLCLMLVAGSVSATDNIAVRYKLSGTVGWLNRDDKIAGDSKMTGLNMDRPVVAGGTFAVEFLPTGKLHSLQQWNNASIGLAATVINLGQDQYLGNVYALWTYLNIPLVHAPHFEFGLRAGVGLGFADKRYSNTVPAEYQWERYNIDVANAQKRQQIANISIGSVANAFLNGGIYMDFPIRQGWALTLAAGWQHMSNGSVLTPNGGYNMFNAELGVSYTPSKQNDLDGNRHANLPPSEVPRRLWDGVTKKWDIEIGVAGGVRSVYYADRSIKDNQWLFGVGEVNVACHWVPISIFRIGLGVDLFYDDAYRAVCVGLTTDDTQAPKTKFAKTYLAESDPLNCLRVGISLQPEFVVGNFTFGYHLGLYLYDPIKNLEPYDEVAKNGGKPLNRGIIYGYDMSRVSTYQDGWFYQRLQLKYHCTKHLYVQLGLKLHIMKAEFIDAGLGIRI